MSFFVGEFQDKLNVFIEEVIPREFVRRQIDTALFMLNAFRYYTPELTGHAWKNWMITPDFVTTSENGVRFGNNPGQTTAKYISLEEYRILMSERTSTGAMKFKMGSGAKIGGGMSTFWVYNNVRYMQALVDGHSRQAPQGWFDIVLSETKAFMFNMGHLPGSVKTMSAETYRKTQTPFFEVGE